MKAYKGFDKDLKCRGFQYEIGNEYEEKKAIVCKYGFHSCLEPMDVFDYYPLVDFHGNLNRFCEVEIPEEMDKSNEDSKVATKKIKIVAEIGIKGIIEEGVNRIIKEANGDDSKYEFINIKNYSSAINVHHHSSAINIGAYSFVDATRDHSCVINTGEYSIAGNTGIYSTIISAGDYSCATSIGDYSSVVNAGNNSSAYNAGFYASSSVVGEDSIAITTGKCGKAKGALGCYLILAERNIQGKLVDIKVAKVDGVTIKADTYYSLINGEFVEC